MARHHFDCVVDTEALAKSVSTVNTHIKGTSTAVVAMKAAVVEAEAEGAQHVCEKVNTGFYALIHSQISQKMAALKSEIDAKYLRLCHQRKQLDGIRARMSREYQMVCARYSKIFTAINRELKVRVTELDQPVMKLVNTDVNKMSNRETLMAGNVPVGQLESVKLSQQFASSNLKKRAEEAIDAITRFIADLNHLDQMINAILLRKRLGVDKAELLVPVSIIESNYDNTNNNVSRLDVCKMGLSSTAVNAIENRMSSALHSDEFQWNSRLSDSPEVRNQFVQCVNNSGLDERRKKMILQMFDNSDIKTF